MLEELAVVFGRPPEWERALPIYARTIADLTDAELRVALVELLGKHVGFMPRPAEILAAAGRDIRPDEPRGWATHCAQCGCHLSLPASRRHGVCMTCGGG